MIRAFQLFLLFLPFRLLNAQEASLSFVQLESQASFRSISVVDDDIAWIGGSEGTIGRTLDGGRNWQLSIVEGLDAGQFRSIYAFDEDRAIIANAGSPAVILKTEDGGNSWEEVYRDTAKAAFLDGIDFWNEHEGMAYGDPKNGRMDILFTEDGGDSWKSLIGPFLQEGEASFAASGTGIRCYEDGMVMISTGGLESRIFQSDDLGMTWEQLKVPILKGQSATGIFSHHFKDEQNGIVVGGDYTKETERIDHNFLTANAGQTWTAPETPTFGYREVVEYIEDETWLSAGPSGIDISYDDGYNWEVLSSEKGFHTLSKAREGEIIMAAGAKGKVAIIKLVK